MHDDNFLHERGGQRFWCWVASWRERVVQHFDDVLLVVFQDCPSHHIAIYACPTPQDSYYDINMEYNSIRIINFMKI